MLYKFFLLLNESVILTHIMLMKNSLLSAIIIFPLQNTHLRTSQIYYSVCYKHPANSSLGIGISCFNMFSLILVSVCSMAMLALGKTKYPREINLVSNWAGSLAQDMKYMQNHSLWMQLLWYSPVNWTTSQKSIYLCMHNKMLSD